MLVDTNRTKNTWAQYRVLKAFQNTNYCRLVCWAGKQRFPAEDGDILLPSGELLLHIAEERINDFVAGLAVLIFISILVAIAAGKIAGVPWNEEQLNLIALPTVEEVRISLPKQSGFIRFVGQVSLDHILVDVGVPFIDDLLCFFPGEDVCIAGEQIHDEVLIRICNL